MLSDGGREVGWVVGMLDERGSKSPGWRVERGVVGRGRD